ncbi:MAG: GHKL domain-containing protein [Balneolaceae bacterium]|nr:GHKL domain-containing protein [Balneolaceae bacterium]
MKTYKVFLTIYVSLLSCLPLSAQQSSFQFERLTPADGLASSTVIDIAQDSYGFIWIGSQDGLSRYDGRTFKHFRPNPRDSLSISSLNAEYLTADNKGGVWVTITDQGLDYYDAELEGFRRYRPEHGLPQNQRYIEVSIDGFDTVWASTDSSIYRLNKESYLFEKDEGQRAGSIYRLYAANNGELLFFMQSGASLFIGRRSSDGEYTYTPLTRDLNPSGSHPYRMHLIIDDDGTEWLINQDLIARKASGEDSWQRIPVQNSQCLSNLREAQLHGDGYIWVKTTESLCQVTIETGGTAIFRHNPENPHSILPIRAGSDSRIYIDRQGVLWIAHFASGISRVDLYGGGFHLYNMLNMLPTNEVISVLESSDGTFWVGTRMLGSSLVRMNRDGRILNRFGTTSFDAPRGRTVTNQLSHPHIFALTQSQDGSIWAGSGSTTSIFGGLNRIRPGSSSVVRFKNDPNDTGSLPNNDIQALATDGSNRVWFLTPNENLHWINPSTERISSVELPDSELNPSYQNQALYTDSDGNVWIIKAERDVLFVLDHESISVNKLELQSPPGSASYNTIGQFNSVHQDVDGRYWISTNLGFGQFSPVSGEIILWYSNETHNLPSSEIAGMQSDGFGNLWLSTSNGIVKFNIVNEQITHFGYDRGLQGNIFNPKVNHRGASGDIYFGGAGGLNVFTPDLITTNPLPPDIVFTALYLDGREIMPGEDAPISESLLTADVITVDPDITTITIEFAALHFASPAKNQYRYKLEGFDNLWRYGGTSGSTTYTNLPPGEYTFRLMASNRDGFWSDGLDQIKIITVLPPWWRTWWAYTIYFILFALGVFVVDRVQRRRLILREREKTRERELAQAKEIESAYHELESTHLKLEKAHENLKKTQEQLVQQEKLASLGQLTAGIAHEIKNPLNFVNNFSEVSIELVDEARTEVKNIAAPAASTNKDQNGQYPELVLEILDDLEANLKKIFEHGSRADKIVKSMLMHSRGSGNEMVSDNINRVLKEAVNLVFHGMKASSNPIDIDIEFNFDEKIVPVKMITEDISRVILNLTNNAFDAMREKSKTQDGESGYKPKLTVRTRQKRDQVLFEIEDNGPGIPAEIKNKILQPFFTTKKGTEGTGLGLSITNDIIKMHRGSLQIISEDGKTIFSIELPVK